MNTQKTENFEIISKYTSEEATEDGLLFAIETVNKNWAKNGLISHITTTLLTKGYMSTASTGAQLININKLVDLLNQAIQIVKRANRQDWFYNGRIELPNGDKQEIYIAQNEAGRFTLMLPEDY